MAQWAPSLQRGGWQGQPGTFFLLWRDIILRAFYTLYLKDRLSKTELEHALLNGPEAIELLFTNRVRLCKLFPGSNEVEAVQSVITNRAEELSSFDFAEMGHNFVDASDANEAECDHCGETEKLKHRCSQCHVAFYCGKDCQKGDRKRHRPLCLLIEAKYEDVDSKDSWDMRAHERSFVMNEVIVVRMPYITHCNFATYHSFVPHSVAWPAQPSQKVMSCFSSK